MNWFKSKREKELEAQVEELKARIDGLMSDRNRLTEIKAELKEIRSKVIPAPVINKVYTTDAIALANDIKLCKKKQRCGGIGCRMVYEVDCKMIDVIAKSKPETATT